MTSAIELPCLPDGSPGRNHDRCLAVVKAPHAPSANLPMRSPLAHPEWVAFNERKWGLTAHAFHAGSDHRNGATLDAILYANRSGKLRPVPHTLYSPVSFRPTSSSYRHRSAQQWVEVSMELASHMHAVGLGGPISLDLPVADARAWQRQGFRVEPLYTHVLEFPFDLSMASSSVRKAVNKAAREGYTCERTTDAKAVLTCIQASEQRQGFSQGLTLSDLEALQTGMGAEACRMHLCRAANGSPASAQITLHAPDSSAIAWVGGTVAEHLQARATQLLLQTIIDDVQRAGARTLNMGGANLPHIAAHKADWSGRLATYYVITAKDLRTLLKDGRDWLRTATRPR